MRDPLLRSVSLEARGLWIDMLCVMAENDPRGYFQINGEAPSETQSCRMLGCTGEELRRGLEELRRSGVFSVTSNGVIYSRRMVKDDQLIKIRQKCGKMGGNPMLKKGHKNPYYNSELPILVNQKDNQTHNQQVNQVDKQKITPSYSLSSSSSKEEKKESTKEKKARDGPEKCLFGHLLLLPEEYEKLKKRYNGRFDAVLDYMNLKIESKGLKEWRKQYKSDYATILVWDDRGWLPETAKKEVSIFDY